MEKINTEILVSSLFAIGFDKVDTLLYTYTLGQLSIDNQKLQLFDFDESETSQIFNEFVDYNGIIFKLKDGITLETNVSPVENHVWPLGKALHTNKKLIDYLSRLDFRKIIVKKVESLGVDRIDNLALLFSNKERNIMKDIIKENEDDLSIASLASIRKKVENPVSIEDIAASIVMCDKELEHRLSKSKCNDWIPLHHQRF